MAANLALLCALALIAVTGATPAGVCPYPDPMDHTVHLADLTNCNAFYRCDNGTPKREFCPASLHFNPTLQVCDWPANAGCVLGTTTTTSSPTTSDTTPTTSTTPVPTSSPTPTPTACPTTTEKTCETTPDPCDKKDSCESKSSCECECNCCEDESPECPEPTTPSTCTTPTTTTTTTPTPTTTTTSTTTTTTPTPTSTTTSTTTTTTGTTSTTSTTTTVEPGCPNTFGPGDVCRNATESKWMVPHPTDSTKFYKCEIASCRAFLYDCPPNLVFDPDTMVCVWPEGYCPSPFGPGDVCRNATSTNYHVADPENPSNFYKCEITSCRAHLFECPDGLEFNEEIQVCDWPASGCTFEEGHICNNATADHWHMPHPTDPSKFYKCELSTCKAHLFDCPDDLEFNPEIQVCDWPAGADCPNPFGPDDVCRDATEFHWHLPDPTDVTKFYKCEIASCRAFQFDCPDGLHFNPPIQVCDWPSNVRLRLLTQMKTLARP